MNLGSCLQHVGHINDLQSSLKAQLVLKHLFLVDQGSIIGLVTFKVIKGGVVTSLLGVQHLGEVRGMVDLHQYHGSGVGGLSHIR